MARGDHGFGGGHGDDSDTDQRPGNAYESRDYAKQFDPRNEQEYTAAFLEAPDAVRLSQIRDRHAREAREARREAQSRVHYFQSVGKFIKPRENTWAANASLVKDDKTELHFDPLRYVYFDKIIAEQFGKPALFDAARPDFARYEGLRTNLEVLRNVVMNHYFKDGSFDPGDEKHIPQIQAIAAEIGNALGNDKWYKRPFTRSFPVDVANVEGVGAAEMYKFLLSVQHKPGYLRSAAADAGTLIGFPKHEWQLSPLDQSPFGEQNMSAPLPPPDKRLMGDEPIEIAAQRERQSPVADAGDEDRALAFSENALRSAKKLSSVEALSAQTKDASIEEARTILRWLRNLQFTDKPLEEWLDHGTQPEQRSKLENLSKLVSIYERQVMEAVQRNPQLANELAVQDGSEAAGGISQGLAAHLINTLPENDSRAVDLAAIAKDAPDSHRLMEEQSLDRLLATVELGLASTANNVYEKSAAERLTEMSRRIQAATRQLRPVESMEEPAREESIELAREILRKLKNLSFSDKPVEQLINTGSAEDKATFAQKIEEMVDTYKNLLAEAAQSNPDILQNQQVKEANQAVETFMHSVKLMAAKEMPGSIAAAQQIAADVTQTPEDWNRLHHHTVNRLLHSMEGGLEKAVSDISTQQQDQQQDDDLAQEIIQAALLHSDSSRRKKRRKRQQKSGGGGKKQQKQAQDLTADDYVLKQGRFNQDVKTARDGGKAAFMGLNDTDLAAIRKLGGNLRDIGKQAGSMPMASVTATDPLKPDDKTVAARTTEERERNPKNQGPRV